ncbi:MAG: GNAT family N-acetyltransferase [Paludibacterium sp.]|uniref:GNAT family N-acetyltransferase n=1 Tax=Paludibacterium sp. TaxID=1917523 RepID=UPI0025F19917|nr:GNAT family N-acetyltransferase [Paludibacterium sp.]MBV8048212.1 GNAT family N-acetyltransferase [Paludibacterium sp.]MBV8648969.1 GNAT family N-acetyltransferase [Paludibacterium sp.]
MVDGRFNIIPAVNTYIDQIKALHVAGLMESGSFSLEPGLDADLDDVEANYFAKGGVYLLAVDPAGKVVGMGALRYIDGRQFEIKRMRVAAEYRRCGIAAELLRRLLSVACERGGEAVVLDTSVKQYAAQKLYESFGFVPMAVASIGGVKSLIYKKGLLDSPDERATPDILPAREGL